MDYQVIGYSSSKEADAIILLTPPNYKGTKAIPFFLGGGIKLFFKTSPLIFFRLLKYETHAMKLKEKHTSHQCWYLYNITVKPDYQKNGMCSKILKPILEYLDKIEQDCYLETHKESNVSLYEHFGFKLVEISCIPNTDIKHFAMLRKYNKNKEV